MADSNSESSASGNALTTYLRETRGEVRKVTWPTREEAIRWTGLVIAVLILMTAILSSFDWIFSSGLTALVDAFLDIGG